MVACCTHTGPRTTLEVMAHSRNPVIFSHSNPRALHDHQRNISDEAMRACAATGGVVGINGVGIFLGENDISTETVVRHIDYAVSLIGIDHVGFGFDYVFDMDELIEYLKTQRHTFPAGKGYDNVPKFVPPEQLPEIIAALLRRGYKEQRHCQDRRAQPDAGGAASLEVSAGGDQKLCSSRQLIGISITRIVVGQRKHRRHQIGDGARLDHLVLGYGRYIGRHVGGNEARTDGGRADAMLPAAVAHGMGEREVANLLMA